MMDFAILVGSCDKYHYLWKHFSYLFDKYWDSQIVVPKYIITQELDADIRGFTSLKVKDPTFSIGVKRALDSIKCKHILWLQDDYFLQKTIYSKELEMYYAFFLDNKAGRFGIHDDSEFYAKLPVYNNIYKFHQMSLYTISMQASFWDVNFLYDCFDKTKEENPWEFEVEGSNRLNNSIMHRIFFAQQPEPWYLEACRKGNFTKDFYTICEKEGLNAQLI